MAATFFTKPVLIFSDGLISNEAFHSGMLLTVCLRGVDHEKSLLRLAMGERQKRLLKLLRGSKPGLSMDELSKGLEIMRNAVRQHFSSREVAGLVSVGATPVGGGRPQQLYILIEQDKEMSPRQYSWLTQLVAASVQREAVFKTWVSA